ncbi:MULTISPECIES: GTP pyrophosphokinase [unclassified Pseudomonas]|uniref:GTP pyrophosphokinase n=1 Tax=unclassified Pseudomonas TaxID=196821 RepID=UPI00244CA104|nr:MULTISPECIES: GTP pyrophosphokinase [unclassified Pseudomonas]MDH0303425.1 GTP pyrophosphokinase [Pseudomonas sp. GD04091]MDH1984508.1 GTP pyrophosphokinase [Pseudomonas sp. GD03689]
MATLERAIAVATRAHDGQYDKGGAAYILHPLRVMARVVTPEQRIVAVLHDVLEDTPLTLSDLAREGFPLKILAALLALSRREGESYEAFVVRLGVDPLARQVKLADLADNSDLSRIPSPGPADLARLSRYQQASAYLRALT